MNHLRRHLSRSLVIIGALVISPGCSSPTKPDRTPVRIVVLPRDVTFDVGVSRSFKAVGLDTRGDTVELSRFLVEWHVRDPELATVTPDGTVKARNDGITYVIARYPAGAERLSDSTIVTISRPL